MTFLTLGHCSIIGKINAIRGDEIKDTGRDTFDPTGLQFSDLCKEFFSLRLHVQASIFVCLVENFTMKVSSNCVVKQLKNAFKFHH